MLTGEPPHTGASAQAIIMKIIAEDAAPVTKLRKSVPANVAAALSRALEKLPADRFESAKAFAEALLNPAFRPTSGHAAAGWGPTGPPGVFRGAFLAVAGIAVLLLAALLWSWRRPKPAAPAFSYYINGDTAQRLTQTFALSPDGTVLVYRAVTPTGPMLFRRRLAELEATPIPGTADADEDPGTLFFSPDGSAIGFSAGPSLKRVRLDGTELQTVTTLTSGFAGATWGPDGSIVYALFPDQGLMRVSAQGGTPSQLLPPGPGFIPISPRFLPGGKSVLCVNFGSTNRIGVVPLATGVFKPVVDGVSPTYLAPGVLVYGRLDGSVVMQPFNPQRGDTTGPGTTVLQGVMSYFDALLVYDISETGVVTFLPRQAGGAILRLSRRDGASQLLANGPRFWVPRFSPDGRHIAYGSYGTDGSLADLWSFDLMAGTDQRLTSGGQKGRDFNDPVWSPDGRWLALSGLDSVGKREKNLYLMPAAGGADPTLLLHRSGNQFPTDWTRDGETILFTDGPPSMPYSIWLVRRSGGAPVPVVKTQYNALGGRLSPDGRWLAYQSDETGQPEVYIQRFPDPGPRLRVSTAGGQMPMWSRSGKDLYYWYHDQLTVAGITLGSETTVTARTPLFRAVFPPASVFAQYDVSPDGRFVLSVVAESSKRLAVLSHLREPGR
jgi:eukaryotic-like serine/threonine-protein kinase